MKGTICPLFLYFKMNKQKVQDLVNETLKVNKSLFLTDLSFLPNNKILVEVDGDLGVSLEEIIRISRNIEYNLDREEEDFALEVTSPDISKPLKVKRQYTKNINKILKVKTAKDVFVVWSGQFLAKKVIIFDARPGTRAKAAGP